MNTVVFLLAPICVLFFTRVECMGIACPKQVSAKAGEIVTIECHYSRNPPANKYMRKYFCEKGERFESCKKVITTNEDFVDVNFVGRVKMTDDKENGIITTTIFQVDSRDEGTYICGIGMEKNKMNAVISLAVIDEMSITVESELIYSELWSTVTFQCKSDEQSGTQVIYFCKISKTDCKTIIDSLGNVDPAYAGRVTIKADEQNPGTSYITLAQLQAHDAACYSCGIGKTTYDLRVNEETGIPQSSGLLTPRLGGSLSAQCNYNSKKNFTMKSWCRWNNGSCTPIINTGGEVKDTYEGRIFIYDDPSVGIMQVVMNNISKEDEGWYWSVLSDAIHKQICVIQVSISNVHFEGLYGNNVIQVVAGNALKIPCSYPCKFKAFEMFWCRWSKHGCKNVISKADKQNNPSLSCEPQEFMLNFESVSLDDSGVYWCGVKKAGKYVETIAVQIIVKEHNFISRPKGDPRYNEVMLTTPSYNNNTAVMAASFSVCAVVLVTLAVFFLRMRRRNNSDLVSVGSYRTNISLTDLYNSIGKDNAGVTDLQESCVSNTEGVPKKKKESQEERDYSSFLIHQNANEQDIM